MQRVWTHGPCLPFKKINRNSVPRKRSEKRTGTNKIEYVRTRVGRKKAKKLQNKFRRKQKIPAIAAVNISRDALVSNYELINNKTSLNTNCLIDTGAAISVLNFTTWKKLGEPRMRTSRVGNILLSNNVQMQPEGIVSIKVRIGANEYPINMVVMKNWRYDAILGLDFLESIGAVIHVKGGKIQPAADKVINAVKAVADRKARTRYNLVAKENTIVRPGHEARIVAEVDGAFPDHELYLVNGKHIAEGVCENSASHELVVFYRAGTIPHVIKKGTIIGEATLFQESDYHNSRKKIPDAVNATATDSETDNVGEKNYGDSKPLTEEEML